MTSTATTRQTDYLTSLLDDLRTRVTLPHAYRVGHHVDQINPDAYRQQMADLGYDSPRRAPQVLRDHVKVLMAEEMLATADQLATTTRAQVETMTTREASALIDAVRSAF